jgi:hypothetical protein
MTGQMLNPLAGCRIKTESGLQACLRNKNATRTGWHFYIQIGLVCSAETGLRLVSAIINGLIDLEYGIFHWPVKLHQCESHASELHPVDHLLDDLCKLDPIDVHVLSYV